MNDGKFRVIVAVENPILQDALLSAIAPLCCSPEFILPDALLQAKLSGLNHILLETSNDVERLVTTCEQLWEKWGEAERAYLQFLSYSSPDVTPDSVVFRLWSVGPEMTVIVQIWNPDQLAESQQQAYSYTRRVLKSAASEWGADDRDVSQDGTITFMRCFRAN